MSRDSDAMAITLNAAKHGLWQLRAVQRYGYGVLLAVVLATAAAFLAQRYGAPVMLMALLIGLAFHFLSTEPHCALGLQFASRGLLRLGVALLGLRISLDQVLALGWQPLLLVCTSVFITLGFGVWLAKKLGFSAQFGVLTGGAVAICGASAAMAISCVLPQSESNTRNTLFAVISVTTLSTVAMVLYPLLVAALSLSPQEAGLFLGATIHDVAQVVGAGYSVSAEVGEYSTFFKLLRVAMLVPVVMALGYWLHQRQRQHQSSKLPVPGFLLGFVALFLLNSFVSLPESLLSVLHTLCSGLLVTAVAALGVKTSLQQIAKVGLLPVLLVLAETLFIASFVLFFILF